LNASPRRRRSASVDAHRVGAVNTLNNPSYTSRALHMLAAQLPAKILTA
jgi:hypothetical protein